MNHIKKSFLFLLFCILIFSLVSAADKDHFVIGAEEGESELVYPRQVKEGPDGRIYVYDRMDAYIKVYSPAGAFTHKMGGKGEGPGEIKRIDGVGFGFTHDKKLFFKEYFTGHRWMTFMNLDGSLHKTLNLQIKETFFGIGQVFFLPAGRFLVRIDLVGEAKKKKDYFLRGSSSKFYLVDAKGKILSKIKELEYITLISFLPNGGDTVLPFLPGSFWAPFKNNTILFSDGLSTKIQVINYQGETVSEIETSLPECRKVTRKDLNAWKKKRKEAFSSNQSSRNWYKRFGSVIEKYEKSIYDKKPNITGMWVTPAHNILAGSWDIEKEENIFWLIDEKGKTIIKINTKYSGLRIDKNFLFFKTSDEEEVITVHCMKRRGSEKEDLLRTTQLKF